MNRRAWAGASLALGMGLVGYGLIGSESEEERIRSTLTELAEAVSFTEPIGNPLFHGSRLNERFEDLLVEQVQVSLAEVAGRMPNERSQLGLATARVLSQYGSLSVSLAFDAIDIEDKEAHATVEATVLADQGGLRTETRQVEFGLVRDGSRFRIASIRVSAPQ